MFTWDPTVYRRYDDERSRPFHDLVARVGAGHPRQVVDLGCGPGHLTRELARRWPGAQVLGTDDSAEMLAAAAADDAGPGVRFELQDVRDWAPGPDTGVAVCNAVLQWVPDHLPLVARWAGGLAPGAWLALQVPGNFDSPSHTLMRDVATGFPELDGVLRHADQPAPADYAAALLGAGLRADVWETTYLHVLTGEDPVLDWVRGTGLRPVLAALADPAPFLDRYRSALREAYPRRADGSTLLPFRRVFAVGHRA